MAVERFGWLLELLEKNSGSHSAKKHWGKGSIRADGVALQRGVRRGRDLCKRRSERAKKGWREQRIVVDSVQRQRKDVL